MKNYIVLTLAGFTQDENGEDCENMQVLGIYRAKNEAEARFKAHIEYAGMFPSTDEYRVYKLAC